MGKPDPSEKKAAPAKPKTTTKAATTAPSVKKTIAKKAATKAVQTIKPAAKPPAPKQAAPAPLPPPIAPTSDEIGLRAYFISEKRHQLGLPGDSAQDWVEAERQLIEEAKVKKPMRKKTA